MSNNIKPSEVSGVLLRELQDVNTDVKFEEVGVVLSIGDGVAHIYGLTNVTENELIEFENGVMGVAMNLERITWAQCCSDLQRASKKVKVLNEPIKLHL